MPYQNEMKGIKLLQDRASSIEDAHGEIGSDLEDLKRTLMSVEGAEDVIQSEEYAHLKEEAYDDTSRATPLQHTDLSEIYAEAEARYVEPVGLADILSIEDFAEAEKRVDRHVLDFNRRYGLDGWDYAIAGSCGLFAAMLDLLCVRAPLETATAFDQKVDGIFNQAVQVAIKNPRSKLRGIGGSRSE